MFPELENVLRLEASSSRLVCVTEEAPAEASFVLCHLINTALKNGERVCVVAQDKVPSHYRHLCAKCGGSVRQAEAAGTLTFVDCGEMALQPPLFSGGPLSVDISAPLPLKPLFEHVLTVAGPPPVLLVLDGLGVLVDLGAPVSEVLLLVHNLTAWASASGGLVAVLTPSPSVEADDDDLTRLTAAVSRQADLTVAVRGLRSGHCPEVTGELEVRRRGAAGPAEVHQFRAEDRNVRVFAPGTSRAVL